MQTVGMSCAREVPGKGHQHSLRDVGAHSLRGRAPPVATLWSVSARGTRISIVLRHLLRSQSGWIAPLSARMLASPFQWAAPCGMSGCRRCDAMRRSPQHSADGGTACATVMFCVRSGPH